MIWGATEGHPVIQGVPGIAIGAGLWTWDVANGLQLLRTLGFDWKAFDPERIAVGTDGRVVLASAVVAGVDQLVACHVGEVACSILATSGDTAAGVPDGWTLHRFTSVDLDVGEEPVFTASLDTGNALDRASGVFAWADELVLLAITGAALPEPSDATLGAFNGHVRGAADAIVFTSVPVYAFAFPPPETPPLLARWNPSTGLEGLMIGGEPAPGADDGMRFAVPFDLGEESSQQSFSFDLGADGTVAFASGLIGTTGPLVTGSSGIWRCEAASACALLMQEGDPVPEADVGSVFYAWPTGSAFTGVLLGPDGTLGFTATFLLGGEPAHLDAGIFGATPTAHCARSRAVTIRIPGGMENSAGR